MKTYLLAFAMFLSLISEAQYCGTSGPSSCTSDSSLTTPGLTDYHNFPCVSQGIAFSETIQLYVPASVAFSGLTVPVDSIHIDSITNLPCGLCWSTNKASLTFSGSERGCINLSGTSTDATGTYSLGLYGTAYTAFGAFPGSLNTYWGNFYVFVKAPSDACSHGVGTLLAACGAHTSCTITPQVQQLIPVSPCGDGGDTAVFTLTAPYLSQVWMTPTDTFHTPTITVDTHTPQYMTLRVTDSALCTGTLTIFLNYTGGHLSPQICYFTTDTSLSRPNVVVAAQRNNIFHDIDYLGLYGSSTGTNYDTMITSINPSLQAIFTDTVIYKYYALQGPAGCSTTTVGTGFVEYSRLTVDSNASGYPTLSWPLQFPITYSSVYVFARVPGGAWQVIDSIFGITGTNLQVTYVDQYPTSAHMDYMLGYNLNNACDPSRTANKTVFTNASKAQVRQALVTTRPAGISDLSTLPLIDIYPNPATDKINVLLHGVTDAVSIAIYDMTGKLTAGKEASIGQTAIDISALASGIYLLKATDHGRILAVKKIVKN
ncbi:MAG: hypothetical protein JWO03_1634 [Bacteroidetes bacterium]|nr:hypothetical protein [Bacteroidota bacterium]